MPFQFLFKLFFNEPLGHPLNLSSSNIYVPRKSSSFTMPIKKSCGNLQQPPLMEQFSNSLHVITYYLSCSHLHFSFMFSKERLLVVFSLAFQFMFSKQRLLVVFSLAFQFMFSKQTLLVVFSLAFQFMFSKERLLVVFSLAFQFYVFKAKVAYV